ncbi:MAG: dockerin type I repeat-containing protein [Candidatus Omnitrophica bacterium]|nr:dockerin type I repeat-containing protein [Candidatus Omnitrophota bacterium]MCB9720327.1 hypothetical protein [Candidatus Omnitrophota bacterium]
MRSRVLLLPGLLVLITVTAAGAQQPTHQSLSVTAEPYVKYFLDRTLDDTTEFEGLTRSYQRSLEPPSTPNEGLALNGAAGYDMSILGHLRLGAGDTSVIDRYVHYYHMLDVVTNPLYNTSGDYTDDMLNPIKNGPFRIIRISGRDVPDWFLTWDFVVDTGAGAALAMYALDAHTIYGDQDYLEVAGTIGDFMLKLVDGDGGVRFGPVGMYHPSGPDFFWELKSTEQNMRVMYTLEALSGVTGVQAYADAAAGIRSWLKTMYDFAAHLFCEAAIFDGATWGKVTVGAGASPTDVTAFAPLRMMLEDSFFGTTYADRAQEVDDMFNAIEQRNAFFDGQNRPLLFRFSLGQQNQTFGSIEWSSQMALAYLRAVELFTELGDTTRAALYQERYDTLIANLESLFTPAPDDSAALIASYAIYPDGSPAGSVLTGTGFATINAEAALACAWFAFAKAGFDPTIATGRQSISYGDVNADGIISAVDASQAARYSVLLLTLSPDAVVRGDVNGDGAITAIDASQIARYSVGLLSVFPVQSP